MKTAGKSNIRIFAGAKDDKDNSQLKEMIALLKDYGVNYTEKINKSISSEELKDRKFEIKMDCRVNKDVGRIIAKIAFNYFALCAQKDNLQDILYHPNFEKIKAFILGDERVNLHDIMSPDNSKNTEIRFTIRFTG